MTTIADELREQKAILEKNLSRCLSTEVGKFVANTGAGISNIEVKMIETTTISSPKKVFGAGGIKVDVTLEI